MILPLLMRLNNRKGLPAEPWELGVVSLQALGCSDSIVPFSEHESGQRGGIFCSVFTPAAPLPGVAHAFPSPCAAPQLCIFLSVASFPV